MTLGGAMAFAGSCLAGTSTWTGLGGDENMSTAGNWDVAPVAGDDLIFTGTPPFSVFNDLEDSLGSGVFSPNSLTFDALAEDFFEIDGNALNLNGKTLTNDSPYQHDILADVIESGGGITFAGQGDIYIEHLANSTWNHQLNKSGSGTLHVAGSNDSIKIAMTDGVVEWPSGNGTTQLDIHGGSFMCVGTVDPTWYGTTVNMQNDAATSPATFSLPGNVNVEFRVLNGAAGSVVDNLGIMGETSVLQLRQSNSDFAGTIRDGASGGKTGLELTNADAPQTVTLSGASTYSGGTTVNGGATLVLASTGSLTFFPEAAGVVNGIGGGGTCNIDGTFIVDLGGVGTPTSGDSWSLVGTTANFGSNFQVAAPFAETAPDSGIWTYNDGSDDFFFSESSGTLSYGRTAETIWTGGGGDDLWSTNPNWHQNPLTGDLLLFDGSTQTTNTNDLDTNYVPENATDPENIIPADPATFLVGGIRFEPTADPFTLQGTPIEFAGKTITNNSPNTQTIDLQIQTDSGVSNGAFTVDAAAGDVVLNNVQLRNGFSKPLVKTGPNTLYLNGPLGSPDTYNPQVNQGMMVANSPGNLFFHVDIAAGATLRTEANVIHNGGRVNNNGTLNLAEGVVEDTGALFGSGVVTNHGAGGTTSTISTRQGDNRTFSGTIKDGASGGKTALQVGLSGRTEAGIMTLSGANTYTGNTTMGQATAGLTLSSTGSLVFAPGANGVSNLITAPTAQTTGTVTLDGNFRINVGGADLTDGNAWTLVNVANLNETFGANFKASNANYAPATTYQVNGGGTEFAPYVASGSYVSGGGNASWPADTRNLGGVTDPAPAGAYEEYRYGGDFTYTFTGLGAGTGYNIRLHFLEGWHSSTGQRIFDVIVNGVTMIDDIDLVAAAGGKNIAFTQTLNATADLTGKITVRFLDTPGGDSNAAVSAIEITPDGSGSSSNFSDPGDTGVWTMVDGANNWTFTEATGVLSLSIGGGGDAYATWWMTNYPGLTLTARTDDNEGDGRANVVEFYLNGDPTLSDRGLDPAGVLNGAAFELNFTRNDDAEGATVEEIEYGGTFSSWTTVAIPAASGVVGGVTFTITENGAGPDDITASIPTGGAADFFARLNVE